MEEMDKNKEENRERNKMKDMPVGKLMIQMGIPMILSMALQAVYNIVLKSKTFSLPTTAACCWP